MALTPEMIALRDRARRYVPGALLPSGLDDAAVLHLVRRLTWGPVPGLLSEVAADPQGWLEGQLDPASVPDGACDGYVARFPNLTASIAQVRASSSFGTWDTMYQLGFATQARQTWSRRQLLEVLVDLWSNHLNVASPSSDVWDNRHDYDRTVIRPHALGSFADMLVAAGRHPAMLRYLDNASSTKAHPNENYARELMELHTVGADAGYGEEGVRAVARVLTGATVDAGGQYTYDAKRHDTGAASVLGWSTPAHDAGSGPAVQESLLRHLASHPATAARIARRLCVRFVSDDPPAALVDRLAALYLERGTAIAPVLRALLASPEFWDSRGAKTRRPLEGFVAALRAIGVTPGGTDLGGMNHLYWMSRELGHAPLAWAPPNGYPDVAAAWQSAGSTMRRWNKTAQVVNGWWPKELVRRPQQDVLPQPLPATYGQLVDALARKVLYRAPTGREAAALLAFCEKGAGSPLRATDEWVTWRLLSLVTMLLDSPGHMER